jgi:hypothetical protein
MKTDKKIVLCRPRGGLNDMFNRMQRCYFYAKFFNRDLYIDARNSGFRDNLDKYFVPIAKKNGVKVVLGDYIPNKNVTVFPTFLNNRLDYKTVNGGRGIGIRELNTNQTVKFDFKKYDEDVVVYEKMGGGIFSLNVFKWLRFTEQVKAHINSVISSLVEYDAVHIRNTDIKTDYKHFFNTISPKIKKKLVLCTDSFECQQYAQHFFGDKLVIASEIPDTKGESLHDNSNYSSYNQNLNTLTDLMILACSKRFFAPKKSQWKFWKFNSGFSRFAAILHFRKGLVKELLK